MAYAIEYLSGNGYWQKLAESTEQTGFAMRPHPTFDSLDEANKHRDELLATGNWRGLRVITCSN